MKLQVLGSSSFGNCYILSNDSEALILEAGVNFKLVKQALNFNLRKAVGCVVTHEHGDHSQFMSDFLKAGIKVYTGRKTHETCHTDRHHNAVMISNNQLVEIGSFKVLPFDVQHDAAEPYGFIINHPEMGNMLFITDTYYVKNTFSNIHNILIEANYSQKIIKQKQADGYLDPHLKNRIIESHMSLETCLDFLKANDLSAVNNIVLIHLSNGNSHAVDFKAAVSELTGKTVHVADVGTTIENFNKTPF